VQLRTLGLILSALLTTLILIVNVTLINASENIKWKTFEAKDGLFTIKYPSNWSPLKLDDEDDSTSLINTGFTYQGKGKSFALINLYGDESIFTNITDKIDSTSAAKQNLQNHKLIQSIECSKYTVNGLGACSQIESFKLDIEGYSIKPLVNQLTVGTIDEDGIEYLILYTATHKQFDDFLPIAEEIIKSFTITGTSRDNDSTTGTDESPELPPLSPSTNGP